MGKMLVVSGADFSENGTPIIDEKRVLLNNFKAALEANLLEHKAYGSANGSPTQNNTARYAVKKTNASIINYLSFVVTPKAGYKFVPIQQNGSSSHITFTWKTSAYTYRDLEAYPLVGFNLANTSDTALQSGMSLWDFIDIELAE